MDQPGPVSYTHLDVYKRQLLILSCISASILISRKFHTINTPFIRIVLALLVVRTVSLVFASTNRIQALYSLPTGLLPLFACILFLIGALYIYAETKKELPLKQSLGFAALLTGLISIFFYFNPFANSSLPASLAFLKNQQFSVLGNVFDSALFYGFIIVGAIGSIFSPSTLRTKFQPSIRIVGLLVSAIALGMMITFLLKNDPKSQTAFQLPPIGASWNAAVETLKQPKTALIGVGIDNFDVLFTATKPLEYNTSSTWQVNYTLSRSFLLHMWAESGILGLLTTPVSYTHLDVYKRQVE